MDNTTVNNIAWCLLKAVEKGKLKAFDPSSGKQILLNQLYTWNLEIHTVYAYNQDNLLVENAIVQAILDPVDITQIKVQQDWYFNYSNGEFFSHIGWIELQREVYSSSGDLMGFTRPFCRIYY